MQTNAVVLSAPRKLEVAQVNLKSPGPEDLIVRVEVTGISTGTEKLFYSGQMPPFPGMGYPLVPGYEAAGEVVEAGSATGFKPGDRVFVPGANCYEDVHGLFGAASQRLVTPAARVARIDRGLGAEGALLALAATAYHALHGEHGSLPELIVGHGVLGRLLARLTIAAGAPAPTVWEVAEDRMSGAAGYPVIRPEDDEKRDYSCIFDASGQSALLDSWIARIAHGGEVVLAGFYTQPIQFAFPPAFMKEARLRIAAEWTPADMAATSALIDSGDLSLAGLITHTAHASDAPAAYETAFSDTSCLKMILDWSDMT